MSYNKKQCGVVRMSLLVPVIGGVAFTAFAVLLVIAVRDNSDALLCAVLGALCLMSLLMILTINQRIDYTPMGFTYRDMFRITHKYSYSQVKKIRYSKDVILHVGHRIIIIDSMAVNGRKFARIAGQYSKNARFITDSQTKMFGGRLKCPEEFIFAYILIALIPIGLALWALLGCRETGVDTLEKKTYFVEAYSFGDTEEYSERLSVTFRGNKDTFYSWDIEENSRQYSNFRRRADSGMAFDVYFSSDDVNSDGCVQIYQLSCEDEVFISSIDKINKNIHEMKAALLILSAIIFGIWLLYIASSIYFIYNAEKHPRLVKLFVKPDYIIKK